MNSLIILMEVKNVLCKKIPCSILLSFILLLSFNNNTIFAASVGDYLEQPESGWTRHSYDSPNISYLGTGWFFNVGVGTYASQWEKEGAVLKFNFTGTKIRLISTTWWSFSKDIDVYIDGKFVEKISLNGPDDGYRRIKFEKLGLPNGEHSVEFVNNTKEYVALFAIDTDGPLIPYEPIEPEPSPEPNEPDQGDPSQPEPTEPTTPSEPQQPAPDRAMLVITMDNGLEKEFDLSLAEVEAFISWFETKQAGSGKATYAIDKHSNNKGPFTSRKDYVIFNKILTFEVSEYTSK